MGEWASVFHLEKEEVYCRVCPQDTPPPRPSLWDAGRARKAGKRDDGHRSEWGASSSPPTYTWCPSLHCGAGQGPRGQLLNWDVPVGVELSGAVLHI